MSERNYSFVAGASGRWQILHIAPAVGESLPPADRLELCNARLSSPPPRACWVLRGVVSHERYVTRGERERLLAHSPPLGRSEATRAALICINKAAAWWALPQDERRAILAESSRHIELGLAYLPAIARRLHHGRDLDEEFDFLTWFEYAPEHATAFENLVSRLRATEEWKYVSREIDVRLTLGD